MAIHIQYRDTHSELTEDVRTGVRLIAGVFLTSAIVMAGLLFAIWAGGHFAA